MVNSFNPSTQDIAQCFSSAGITLDDVRIQEVPMPEYAVNSIFIINDSYVLKTTTHYSGRNLQRAATALEAVASAGVSPQLITHSEWPTDPNRYFLIQPKLDGKAMFSQWLELDAQSRVRLMEQVVEYVLRYQKIAVSGYRIGHHQNALPHWRGSWQDGHDSYLVKLLHKVEQKPVAAQIFNLLKDTRQYYDKHRHTLQFCHGATYSHGDLHLYNVLATPAQVSGIVDWEWADTGGVEPDFEMEALLRWAIYPKAIAEESLEDKVSEQSFAEVIPTILRRYSPMQQTPHLLERMTIYQIEHELHKIAKEQGDISPVVQRLDDWLHQNPLHNYLT